MSKAHRSGARPAPPDGPVPACLGSGAAGPGGRRPVGGSRARRCSLRAWEISMVAARRPDRGLQGARARRRVPGTTPKGQFHGRPDPTLAPTGMFTVSWTASNEAGQFTGRYEQARSSSPQPPLRGLARDSRRRDGRRRPHRPPRPTTPPWSRSRARVTACANAAPTPPRGPSRQARSTELASQRRQFAGSHPHHMEHFSIPETAAAFGSR